MTYQSVLLMITLINIEMKFSPRNQEEGNLLRMVLADLVVHGLQMEAELGPVVQSIVSLTSSLRGQLVKCFTTL